MGPLGFGFLGFQIEIFGFLLVLESFLEFFLALQEITSTQLEESIIKVENIIKNR